MKRKFTFVTALVAAVLLQAQTPDFFKPYQKTDLRLPAVPIVVNDPYFSIWSPYDKLNEGTTRHWTGDEKPLTGLLRVDGETYRFMGSENMNLAVLLPMAKDEAWTAPYATTVQGAGWEKADFDDTAWKKGTGAFGSENQPGVRTDWSAENSDVYVRRTVNLSEDDAKGELYLNYSHDDVFEVFINGVKVLDTGNTWKNDQVLHLTGSAKNALHAGKNVIAAHCHNTVGGALLDFGLYRNVTAGQTAVKTAVQKSVSVLATSSYYTFSCGPVDLDVVFTAPMLINDYDLLSTPINYISYQVRSTDKKAHSVQFYMDATPEITVNKGNLPTVSTVETKNGTTYLKSGSIEQPILAKKGDGICIDWGYLYLPAVNGAVSMGSYTEMQHGFMTQGVLPATKDKIIARKAADTPALAYMHDFGQVNEMPKSSFTMIGYDEVEDIEYLYHRYKAYWAHEGKVTIFDAFDKLKNDYSAIMGRCRETDRQIYDDGLKAGNKHYAEILSGSYRHVIAAHKLFVDNEGHLLFFSKENNSNGSVNTVDLTYPEAPLFLVYNPELEKAMMTSILEYSYTGRWTKPFSAHDMGTYPIADGQTYGGDMPLEEAGNMLTLAATICQLEGNTKFVEKYWNVLTPWVNYLVENGQDPANQLCTDDFAGHWAHNCNLSAKAIMGILAYSKLAGMRGDQAAASKYESIAKEMAQKWEQNARENDHYRLAFDRNETWSQKYNMIWDKMWQTNIFPNGAMDREIKYYLSKQNIYGLPLDCRKDYTKSDWIMWTAAMSKDNKTFLKFVEPVYKYINETQSRVPISDWHDTKTGLYEAFIARSVIGGYWMKVLMDKMLKK